MSRKKIILDKEKLRKLYIDENLSPYAIAKIFHCSFSTITNRLKEYKIPLKTAAFARSRYKKKDFYGNAAEKSYMLGFRLGDLNCYKPSKNSEIIVVRCHSTDINQINLIRNLFRYYGGVNISENKGHYYINCFLNQSFEFLLTKSFSSNGLHVLSFTAGYIDAEGNFQINQGRARIKIDSYDYEILKWISDSLKAMGFENKLWKIGSKGDPRNDGTKFNNDLWRLTLNKALTIKNFINSIRPFMKHKKQIANMEKCLTNIEERIKKGSVYGAK